MKYFELSLIFSISAIMYTVCGTQSVHRSKRSIVQFGEMIRFATKNPPLLYNEYGNYCGVTKAFQRGQRVIKDDIDRCCYNHDGCYDNVYRGVCKGSVQYPSFIEYIWSPIGQEIVCTDVVPCRKAVCQCDKDSAECFSRYTYNPRLKRPSIFDIFIHKV